MKKLIFVLSLFSFLVIIGCSKQGEILNEPSEAIEIQDTYNQPEFEWRAATDREIEIMIKNGLLSDSRTKSCIWKDDPTGTVYGTVDCTNGDHCEVVVIFSSKTGRAVANALECVKTDGTSVNIGATRPIEFP